MTLFNRRDFLASGVQLGAAIAVSTPSPLSAEGQNGVAFGNRAHIFVSPKFKTELIRCFSTVLGCGEPKSLPVAGLSEPILAFAFPGGGSLSVEFTNEALNNENAHRGAWMEIHSDAPGELKERILNAKFRQVTYSATSTFYFEVPGGQVLGIYQPREMKATG
jgi:hypothetical protein